MNYLNETQVKSTRLNKMNNKVLVTETYLYCNTCGKSIQENPILCYIFIDYFCSERCHDQRHKIHLEKIVDVD
jgi:hypothetical protein